MLNGSSSGKSVAAKAKIGSTKMQCDLCKRKQETKNLLCENCTEMMQRLVFVDQRMRTRELCEAERLAQSTASASGAVA
jgi:hypothetical protein